MKKLLLGLSLLTVLVSCKEGSSQGRVYVNEPNVVVTPQANVGDNLDLQALGELVRTTPTAAEVESVLNSNGSINNLDLDGDGNVDYVKVTESGDGANRKLDFSVDLPDGTSQPVASIDIEKNNDVANMNIQGNPNLYGNNGYYNSSHHVSDFVMLSYLYGYHRPYYSPYHYGSYPSSYRNYRSVPTNSYNSRVSKNVTTTTTRKVSRPNSSYSTSNTKATYKPVANARTQSLAAPKTSQKSFTVTSQAKARPVTSGFGNKSKTSSSYTNTSNSYKSKPSTSSYKPSSSSRKSSGFGSSSRGSRSSSSRKR